jgi:hypothetical protein
MKNIILPCRLAFFGAFIICNAIICGAAAWNFNIATMVARRMDIDSFLVFLGALSLVFAVLISVIDLTRKDAFAGRVWFECVWVAVFLLLELGGAIVMSVFGPGILCEAKMVARYVDACVSTRLVVAMSWICVVVSLAYLLFLCISASVCARQDPTVWQASVRRYRWDGLSEELPNTANTFRKSHTSIKAPQPRRLALGSLYAHRASLNSQHDVERSAADRGRPVPPVPVIPLHHHREMRQAPAPRPVVVPAEPSLYPRHMESYTPRPNPPLPSRAVQQPPQFDRTIPRVPSPPPLGNWPRADIINQPVRKKRRDPPPPPSVSTRVGLPSAPIQPTYIPPSSSTSRPAAPPRPAPVPSRTPSRTSPPRTGDRPDWRNRVNVPPPLDLSKISSRRPRNQ